MSVINDIIDEIKTIISADTDIADFCATNYGKSACVKTGDPNIANVPIHQIPVIVISDNYDERERRRFLFSEKESNLLITCGILQNDIEKAAAELISFKELIKLAFRKDPLLNGRVTYSVITKSRKLKVAAHPLYFIELVVYVNYKE